MTEEPQRDRCASRRGVLLGAGLAGVCGALAGCSTAAVPYDANEAGQAPGAPAAAAMPGGMTGGAAPAAAASSPAGGGATGGKAAGGTGTLLAIVSEIPVRRRQHLTGHQLVGTHPATQ